jgi:hypothetical protein
MATKRRSIFLIFIPLVICDILTGQRTNAFIYLLFMYLVAVKIKKRLYLKYALPVAVALLVGVLATRAKAVSGNNEAKITMDIALGEFTQTFTTLPYIISKDILGDGFTPYRQFRQFFEGFLPGFIKLKLFNDDTLGGELARHIGRGYGLAFNFITELLYLYNYAGLILIPLYLILLYYLDIKLNSNKYFLFKIMCIIQLRLFVREGFMYVSATIYIFLLYFLIPYLFSKNNMGIKRIFSVN